ncbi:MAG: ribonuclease P protein component [Verrucomicrobia bacterium]|nr:ribonuclease P protein component [Verrucomicrobiota bacterium]
MLRQKSVNGCGFGFKSKSRIRKREEFQTVKQKGKRVRTNHFLAQLLIDDERPTAERRIGIIVTRRLGNAVKRNRAKRVFRELFRNHKEILPERSDLVVIPHSTFFSQPYSMLESDFLQTCKRFKTDR